ncbi:autotransporter domain-containing protein [Pararobbsia silviterrae]|uniref:autotransporter family protein n=1 Tax=Pararobbsia silviterrae TaxID=1792498 RepID=UPI001F0B98ED|nr:autotransporter domain-containing protein [Pararobbsia silviterrae]
MTNQGGGSIGVLSNTGTISSGGYFGVVNQEALTSLINSGLISAPEAGIFNSGTIDTLTNSGTVEGGFGIYSLGTIKSLNNSNRGTISGGSVGIFEVYSSVGTLTNAGIIEGGTGYGIENESAITSLINSGLIRGGSIGIGIAFSSNHFSLSTIGTLTNSGTIMGGATGINNNGAIGTLSNSGTISGPVDAILINSSGSIGTFVNTGTIAGNIENDSNNALSIAGGTGTTFGTLTGYGGAIGAITSNTDVTFASGHQVLNDNIENGSNTVYNNGTALQVDNIVTISGNYAQASGSALVIGVANGANFSGSESDAGYGRLVVAGDVTLAPGSGIALKSTAGGFQFAAGQRFVVIEDTGGTATYNADTLHYSIDGYTSTVTGESDPVGSDTDLVVDILSASVTAPVSPPGSTPGSASGSQLATAPNARAALGGLFGYQGVSNAQLLALYDATDGALAGGSVSTANQIGKQLSPMQFQAASRASADDEMNIVGAHMDSLRLARADTGSGVATGEAPSDWTGWAQAFGGHSGQNARDDVDGYNANYGGLLLGADRALGERWRVGAAFDYTHTQIDNTGDTEGDSAGIDAYGLIGYASYAGSPWYVNLSGAATYQRFDTTRIVSMTGYNGTANGNFNGRQFALNAEFGWPLVLDDGYTVTPLASLTMSHLNQQSYTESGDGPQLEVGGTNVNSVRSALGARLSKVFSTSYGDLVPTMSLKWLHEFDHAKAVTSASFAGDPTGTGFTTVGMAPVSDLADVSLGVTLLRSDTLSLTARYELQAGGGFVSNVGVLRVQKLF